MSRYDYLGGHSWPRTLPDVSTILASLGNPRPRRLAAALRVSERTARRWVMTGTAPHGVHLALFLCTPTAMSDHGQRAEEAARLHAGLYASAKREIRSLEQTIRHLSALARAGAANDPILGVSPEYRGPGSMALPLSPPQGVSALRVTIPHATPASRLISEGRRPLT